MELQLTTGVSVHRPCYPQCVALRGKYGEGLGLEGVGGVDYDFDTINVVPGV